MEEDIRSAVVDNAAELTADTAEASEASSVAAGEQWAKDKAELEDLLRRRQAEFENFRRRVERERSEFAEYAGMESVRSLVPIVDDFERALKAARASGSAESDLVKGIELIYKRLAEALTKQGLEPINTGTAVRSPSPRGRATCRAGRRRRWHYPGRIPARIQFQRKTASPGDGEGSSKAVRQGR